MRYLIPAIHDLGAALEGRQLAPLEFYEAGRKSLQFVGYEGMSMIAVAGIDMAVWDALAKAAGLPLCVLLGGSVGAVPAYNSNGLWLKPPGELAAEAVELRDEGGFRGLKLRLGRDPIDDDLAAIGAVLPEVPQLRITSSRSFTSTTLSPFPSPGHATSGMNVTESTG